MKEINKVKRLVIFLNKTMNKAVITEDYEEAAELRDLIKVFGDYCLGYLKYDDIKNLLFDVVSSYGNILFVDVDRYNLVIFEMLDCTFEFIVDNESALMLQQQQEMQYSDLFKS